MKREIILFYGKDVNDQFYKRMSNVISKASSMFQNDISVFEEWIKEAELKDRGISLQGHCLGSSLATRFFIFVKNNFPNVYDKSKLITFMSLGVDYKSKKELNFEKDRIKKWVADGNTLITTGRGSDWAVKQKIADEVLISSKTDTAALSGRNNYETARGSIGKQSIGGAIFGIDLDITHPIGYGYHDRTLPVYKNNRVWIKPSKNQFSTVGKYLEAPHIDGYISKENLEIMKGAASIVVSKKGRGRVVLFADNPNFRGAWYGTNKLFMNAIHFGSLIKVPQ